MDRKTLSLVIIGALVNQVFTATMSLHPAVKHLLSSLSSTVPAVNVRPTLPAVTITKQTSPPTSLQSLATLASLLAPQTPAPQPQQISPSLLSALQHPQISSSLLSELSSHRVPTSNLLTGLVDTPSNTGVDANLLNNLAMAMQLLIVSNLLNSPPETTTSEPFVVSGYYESMEPLKPVSVSYAPQLQQQPPSAAPVPQKPQQQHYYESSPPSYQQPQHQQMSMPNANFVGSSTFADTNPFSGAIPPMSGASSSRSGFTLMSPYEALSPSSPFSDPILNSPYGSVMTSKRDFQSPYTSIMAADSKDLFSMSDFF